MKKVYIFIWMMVVITTVNAQTWKISATTTDWNTAANWTGGVPLPTGNVIIPTGATNYPKLASNVIINSINMAAGSQLDVNGFTFTVTTTTGVYNYFIGATFNNSNVSTDIVLNINMPGFGYETYFRSNTVNDNITFNLTGSDKFNEAEVASSGNTYNGNTLFNINGNLTFYLSYGSISNFNGNLTVNRTVAGTTQCFNAGAVITGNFSYTNNTSGASTLGTLAVATTIGGTVNIAANYTANNTFTIYRLINQTTGGTINIQNSLGFNIQKDTLKVTSLSVTGYTGNEYGYFYNNAIIGNVTIADVATYSTGWATYIHNNTITGTSSFTKNGTNVLHEADGASNSNTYNGNTSFTATNSGDLDVSNGSASNFNGNLTVSRTVAGNTQFFNAGAVITGNFSYINNTSGTSTFGNTTASIATTIGGTVNIAASYTSNSAFAIFRLINQTTGGTINIQNSTGFNIQRDTLKVAFLSVTGYKAGGYGYFYNNFITGNVTIADDATNSGGWYTEMFNNIITGNSSFTNNGTNVFYDADIANTANTYNGNTSFTATNSGDLNVSNGSASNFNGNLTVTRTVAGTTQFFNAGAAITGNFSYTNNTSGASTFGNTSASIATTIGGTVNIAANYTSNSAFAIFRLINQTPGGIINIQNSMGFNIQRDTLKVISFSVTGYTGAAFSYFYNNSITGNVTIADDATYGGGYYTVLYNNVITGTSSFTNNGTNVLYEADVANTANTYNGNTTFTATNSGFLNVSNGSASNFNGNLTVTRTVAGTTQFFNAGAAITGNFSYTNNTSGASTFGSTNASIATTIGGTVNIAANYTSNNTFAIFRLINQTPGGTINIQNSTGFNIQKDTLKVISLSVTGYKAPAFSYFYNNSITGNVTIADDVTNGGGYYTVLYNNVITGNSSFTNNGSNILYDADVANTGNKYIGNVTYARNGSGTITVAAGSIDEITQNLTLNSASGITLGKIKFNGGTNGIIDQLGLQPININELTMEKSGTGKITLIDSVTVTNTATFTSGNIYTSAGNNLIFPDNISYTGASAASHVIGPVTKIGDDVFTFPIGGPVTLNAVTMSAPVGVTSKFRAEYKNQNPTIDGYNTNLKAGSFGAAAISNAAYWDVQRLSGSTNVTLTLGFGTNPYEQYPVLANLKVAHWNGAQWDDHGNGGTTGTAANGTVVNSVPITSFSPFTIAGVLGTYLFSYGQPGPGPDGSPIKLKGVGGWPGYTVKQLPGGSYTADSIFLVPNGSTTSFRLKDLYGVEKDTTITAPIAPTVYITANGNGTKNFVGWRHFVYMTDGSNNIMGAVRDNDLTLGNVTMNTYFSTANVATASNGNKYLKRSFKITSQFAPVGTKRVRLYIGKTEFTNLVAADPASFPGGINSLTIIKYTGPQEDSLFDPIPGGNSIIIPNSDITIVDLGAMYSLDIDVSSFSGFYISGNNANLNVCTGSTISIPSDISGGTYQWQVDNGGGYVNITNTGIYSGATTKTLTLTNIPGAMYGYKVRCLVNGVTPSQVYTIKFKASWLGATNAAWENPANWSCGQLPDANTDVVLIAGKPNYPVLNSNVSVRSLEVRPGSSLNVNTGFKLTIVK